jgi:hypothetical protein
MSATTVDETTETVDLNTPDKTIRLLVTSGNADERYPVPSKQRFKDEGEGVIEADDLAHIAAALIRDDTLPLGHLENLSIAYLFAEKGGTTGGYPCLGRCIKASKVLRHFGDMDYVVLLSADNLREMKATRWQVEALVAHQLGHISLETTEKGEDRLGVQGHDFEGFTWEFARYGAYLAGMVAPAQAAASAVQMGLVFEGSDEDDEEPYDPAVDQAPGVETEAGPVPDGAPAAEWAEPLSEDDPWPDVVNVTDEEHAASVRAAFPKQFRDGSGECRACGLPATEHATDYCAGSQMASKKSPKNRSGATGAESEESAVTSELALLGHLSASNGNGVHDDFDSPDRDPQMAVRILREAGRQIVFEDGEFRHPSGLPVYTAAWVEGELQAIRSGVVS